MSARVREKPVPEKSVNTPQRARWKQKSEEECPRDNASR